MKYYNNLNKLIHCFGNERNIVNTQEVADMISTSNISLIPINTHRVYQFDDWKKVHIGYGDANWSNLEKTINMENRQPVWNINLPTTSEEAIKRIEYIVNKWGPKAIKLEVLTPDFRISVNKEVIKVIEHFKNANLEIWPLLTANYDDIKRCIDLGCDFLRIMGTPIASGGGIAPQSKKVIEQIRKEYPNIGIMLDGGIGSVNDFNQALEIGCDCVLVNSCLFSNKNIAPHVRLKEFVDVAK